MVTKEDYENLLNYFKENEVPENLKEFIEKLSLIYEGILLSEEYREKNDSIQEKLAKFYKKSE